MPQLHRAESGAESGTGAGPGRDGTGRDRAAAGPPRTRPRCPGNPRASAAADVNAPNPAADGAPPLPARPAPPGPAPAVSVQAGLGLGTAMEALRAAGRAVLRSPRLARHGLGLCRRRSECGPRVPGAGGARASGWAAAPGSGSSSVPVRGRGAGSGERGALFSVRPGPGRGCPPGGAEAGEPGARLWGSRGLWGCRRAGPGRAGPFARPWQRCPRRAGSCPAVSLRSCVPVGWKAAGGCPGQWHRCCRGMACPICRHRFLPG